MSTLKTIAVALIAGAIGAAGAVQFASRSSSNMTTAAQQKESVYDRIMRTKTIRCGYALSPVYLEIDPNTGAKRGVYYDILERMAKDWGVKVDWAEEVSTSAMYEGFKTGRYDMLCSANTITAGRTVVADFSRPFAYPPFYLFVREGDHRFDNAYDKANNEQTSMITFDGYFGAVVTKDYFPKTKITSLPELSTDVDIMMGITTGKADGGVLGGIVAAEFMKKNPGKIRQADGPPLRFPSLVIALPKGEEVLKAAINTSLTYYLETGAIEKILESYGLDNRNLLRVARPYEAP